MRFAAGRQKRLSIYRNLRGSKAFVRLLNFDALLRSKKIIYKMAF